MSQKIPTRKILNHIKPLCAELFKTFWDKTSQKEQTIKILNYIKSLCAKLF